MCTGLSRVCRHASSYAIFGVSFFRIKNPGQNVWDFFVPPLPVVQLLCKCNVAEMRQDPLLWAGNAELWDWAGRETGFICVATGIAGLWGRRVDWPANLDNAM